MRIGKEVEMNEFTSTRVGELVFGKLTVPIRKLEGDKAYPGKVVCWDDLPADLADAFDKWMFCAAVPSRNCAYLHDFQDFMRRAGRGWSGDWSAVVEKYL